MGPDSDYESGGSAGSYSYFGADSIEKGVGLDLININTLILMNPEYEFDTFMNDYLDVRLFTPNITIYSDSRDQALQFALQASRRENLGLGALDKEAISKRLGVNLEEIDVIDTADLDRNMNTDYHGYFNINRAMVDDLYELIVTRKRAEERSTRLKPFGAIYRFTIVPSSVVVV